MTIAEDESATDVFKGYKCPACDYDLSGLTQPQCPECGAKLDISDLRRTRFSRLVRMRFSAFAMWGAAAILLLQLAGEYYVRAVLVPRLKADGLSLIDYEGDALTHTCSILPLIGYPTLILLATSLLFRAYTNDERVPMRRAAWTIAMSVAGLFIVIIRVSEGLGSLLGM